MYQETCSVAQMTVGGRCAWGLRVWITALGWDLKVRAGMYTGTSCGYFTGI